MNIIDRIKSVLNDLRVRIILLSQGNENSIVTNLAIVVDGVLLDFEEYRYQRKRRLLRQNLPPSKPLPSKPAEHTLYGEKGTWECEHCAAPNEIFLDKYASRLSSVCSALKPNCWNCNTLGTHISSLSSHDTDADIMSYWLLNPDSYFWDEAADLNYIEDFDIPFIPALDAMKVALKSQYHCETKFFHLFSYIFDTTTCAHFDNLEQKHYLRTWLKENYEILTQQEQMASYKSKIANFLPNQ